MAVLDQKTVKTRKEHDCCGCARNIPKGTTMDTVSCAEDGSITTFYWCKVCTTYWDKYMNSQDEIGFGELRSEDKEGWEEVRKSIEDING